ncbi:MAG: DUF1186 domain-containing protein [Bacteroidota bacterium]
MLDNKVKVQNYTVTGDPDEADHNQHYSPEIEDLLTKTYYLVKRKKRGLIPRLQKLIKKYPHVPAFQNFLCTYYNFQGNVEKSFEVNRRLLQEHPDYLHGKVNLASEYLYRKDYEKVPEILGVDLDLQVLYPERKVFHSSEYGGFVNVTCHYLIETNQLEAAESRIEEANEVLPDLASQMRITLMRKRMENYNERQSKDDARQRSPIDRGYDKSVQTDEKPTFNHAEIEQLYQHGIDISHTILDQLLALPKSTLIEDLEKVVLDSIYRYEYHFEQIEWVEDKMTFPLHAMFLLAELKATQSLPVFLEVLRQGEDYLDFWYSDHTTETLWEIIYAISEGQLEKFTEFFKEPNLYYLSRSVLTSVAFQVALHQPERKQEVLDWYEKILTYFLDNLDDETIIDTELISLMAWELGDLKAESLIPLIQKCYELDLIHHTMIGDFEEYKTSFFEEERTYEGKRKIFETAAERYEHILTKWHGYMSEEAKEQQMQKMKERMQELGGGSFRELLGEGIGNRAPENKPTWERPTTVKRDAPKVGRNDPCPCGSGKKHKKCCLRK